MNESMRCDKMMRVGNGKQLIILEWPNIYYIVRGRIHKRSQKLVIIVLVIIVLAIIVLAVVLLDRPRGNCAKGFMFLCAAICTHSTTIIAKVYTPDSAIYSLRSKIHHP